MITTFGLSHVALAVENPQRSFQFYRSLLGARLLGALAGHEDDDLSGEDNLEWGTPGSHDVITLSRAGADADAGTRLGQTGSLAHFGFRLVSADDPADVARAVERAGGTVLQQGRFSDGSPFVFARDPDGYELELWFEPDPAWRQASGP